MNLLWDPDSAQWCQQWCHDALPVCVCVCVYVCVCVRVVSKQFPKTKTRLKSSLESLASTQTGTKSWYSNPMIKCRYTTAFKRLATVLNSRSHGYRGGDSMVFFVTDGEIEKTCIENEHGRYCPEKDLAEAIVGNLNRSKTTVYTVGVGIPSDPAKQAEMSAYVSLLSSLSIRVCLSLSLSLSLARALSLSLSLCVFAFAHAIPAP